jgi:hypothetical protein
MLDGVTPGWSVRDEGLVEPQVTGPVFWQVKENGSAVEPVFCT